MDSNPFAPPVLAAPPELQSPLLQHGWKPWLLRVAVLSFIAGLAQLIPGLNGGLVDSRYGLTMMGLWALIPIAIGISLPMLLLGLCCPGDPTHPASGVLASRTVYALGFPLGMLLVALIRKALLHSLPLDTPRAVHLCLSFLLLIPPAVTLFWYVCQRSGVRLLWSRALVATGIAWITNVTFASVLLWTFRSGLQWPHWTVVFGSLYHGLSCLSLGLVLPFVVSDTECSITHARGIDREAAQGAD